MRWWGRVTLSLLLWMGNLQVAWGDILHLSDGRKVEGIITKEADAHLQIQVLWQGTVTVPRSSIRSVVRGSRQDHQGLLKKWHKDFLVDQRREQERAAFEAAQRAKGLVKHEGRWIAREELALIQEKERKEREKKEQKRREEEARRVEERLQALEEENRRLQRQIAAQTELIFRQGVVVHHHDPNLFRDEQGNLIRVQEQLGEKFFTTTDGKRINLESHGGHLTFTDDKGIHRDLKPADH